MVSPLSSNVDLFVAHLKNHFDHSSLESNRATITWNIRGRDLVVNVEKVGLKDLIQTSDLKHLHRILNTIEELHRQMPEKIGENHVPDIITVDLDMETIQINDGKPMKISKLSVKGKTTEEGVRHEIANVSRQLAHSESAVNKLQSEKSKILNQKTSVEHTLKALLKFTTERVHDQQKAAATERKEKLEQQIKELKAHLQRVQEQIKKAEQVVDFYRDKLASLEQAKLVVGIFQQVKNDNYAAFYGREPPTKGQDKS